MCKNQRLSAGYFFTYIFDPENTSVSIYLNIHACLMRNDTDTEFSENTFENRRFVLKEMRGNMKYLCLKTIHNSLKQYAQS